MKVIDASHYRISDEEDFFSECECASEIIEIVEASHMKDGVHWSLAECIADFKSHTYLANFVPYGSRPLSFQKHMLITASKASHQWQVDVVEKII